MKEQLSSYIKKKIFIFIAPYVLASLGILFIIIIFMSLCIKLELIDTSGNSNGGSSGNVAVGNRECGFTISDTSLSKSEFKELIQAYANNNSQWQVFADNADDYYDYAKAKGVNPELVVVVAYKEGGGKTTGGANNYWGLECPNGSSTCGSYSSFMEGAKKLIDSASKYDTLMEWFEKGSYSYIGYFWYNTYIDRDNDGDIDKWGDGGCAYAEYIYPDGVPSQIEEACKGSSCVLKSDDYTSHNTWKTTGVNPREGDGCLPTTDDDQKAYSTYLIKEQMGKARKKIFGLDFESGISCTSYSGNEFIESYVQWMINIAHNDTHGYSQYTSDGGSARYFNPDVDCSSFVYYGLLKGANLDTNELGGSAFTTRNMIEKLTQIGFKVYTFTSQDDLQRGDILWRTGHTEVYAGDGKNVGAHWNYDADVGDGDGREVNVDDTGTNWTTYLRYES